MINAGVFIQAFLSVIVVIHIKSEVTCEYFILVSQDCGVVTVVLQASQDTSGHKNLFHLCLYDLFLFRFRFIVIFSFLFFFINFRLVCFCFVSQY